jgi:hypothetical protein
MADEEEYIAPVSQPHQHKVLIYNANAQVGHRLVEYFRNDHEIEVNPNLIIGTIAPNEKYANDLGLTLAIDVPPPHPARPPAAPQRSHPPERHHPLPTLAQQLPRAGIPAQMYIPCK